TLFSFSFFLIYATGADHQHNPRLLDLLPSPHPAIGIAPTMTGSTTQKQQEWRRSSIGITPLTVRPRPGRRSVKKIDVVGSDGPAILCVPAVQGQKGNNSTSDSFRVEIPARVSGRGKGVAPLSSSRPDASRAGGTAKVCSVCARASADYTCPRCLIGYCSSTCYKAHGSGCTEGFFRGHVERETRLREEGAIEQGVGGKGKGPREARRASMVEVLKRIRHDGQPPPGGNIGSGGDRGRGRGGSGSKNGDYPEGDRWGEAEQEEGEENGEG
ncbi:unnamed protein product, partial [Pylaiella littoralis]